MATKQFGQSLIPKRIETPELELSDLVTATGKTAKEIVKQPLNVIFDTGAITDLYRLRRDELINDGITTPGKYIITEETLQELERQNSDKRAHDDGTALCPYDLMNLIYQLLGEGKMYCIPVGATPEDKKRYEQLYFEHSDDGNSILGAGDVALIRLAEIMNPDPCLLVSPDLKDIQVTTRALGLENVINLTPQEYHDLGGKGNY